MTVIFEQAQRDATANMIAENAVVAQQAAQFQGMLSEFHTEFAMSRNVAQLQGEQYKEYLKSEMQHELQASMHSVTMQARAHVDQIETAAANAANSSGMQARAQVEFLVNAATQKILIVQQSASAAEAAANSMVQMARSGPIYIDRSKWLDLTQYIDIR